MRMCALPEEHLLKLVVNGTQEVSLTCTKADIPLLVAGYLYNEGVVASLDEITALRVAADEGTAYATVAHPERMGAGRVRSSALGGEGLGLKVPLRPCSDAVCYREDYLRECARNMSRLAVRYEATGGTHCSALFDGAGMVSLFEDLGRSNTLDKLAGDCLVRGVATGGLLLVTTGRLSFDMTCKAARMGVAVVASYSTATTKALEAALQAGMSVVGYLNGRPMKVYCGRQRIVLLHAELQVV